MDSINLEKLMEIVNGSLLQGPGDSWIDSVSIDSRKIKKNSLFIPIRGQNNNGHDYFEQVYQNGGQISLTEESHRDFPPAMDIIKVKSTFKSLQDLAAYWRHQSKAAIIAITGSSGKTTTKDLVAAVLAKKYKTLKTQGNFNNEFGIPQTLLQLQGDDELAVVEMGMDYLGDIEKSIELVDPDISVITNIGMAHIEILKSKENIFRAKKEILKTLKKGNIALINGDDPYLKQLAAEKNEFTVKSIGLSEDSDLLVSSYDSSSGGLSMRVDNEEYYFRFPGKHNLYNCLMAIWLGKYYGLNHQEIQKGLDDFKPANNRMDIFDWRGIKIIDDSYNANPDAMRAALDVLDFLSGESKNKKRRIAILGDMLEMGAYARQAHYQIGEYARGKTDILISVGEISSEIKRGFNDGENSIHLREVSEVIDYFNNHAKAGDIILVKASRAMQLDQLVRTIKER